MIFSIQNWNDAAEMNKFIPVTSSLSFESVEASLNNAWQLFIIPLLGDELSADIDSYYDNPSATPEQQHLLQLCQRAIANLAFWYDFTELNMRISDQGFQRQESEGSFKQAYKYQEDNLRNNFRNKGFNTLDTIIDYLLQHTADFPHFEQSPIFDEQKKSLVRNAAEVNEVYFINKSHLVFLRLKPMFNNVEHNRLRPLIGDKMYSKLLACMQQNAEYIQEPTEYTSGLQTEDFRVLCGKYIILLSIASLIRETGSITDRGLYFASIDHNANGNFNARPASLEERDRQAFACEKEAACYESDILLTVKECFPDEYPGSSTDSFKRDNNNKRTIWL